MDTGMFWMAIMWITRVFIRVRPQNDLKKAATETYNVIQRGDLEVSGYHLIWNTWKPLKWPFSCLCHSIFLVMLGFLPYQWTPPENFLAIQYPQLLRLRISFHYQHSLQLSRDPDDDLGEDQTWTEFDSIEHNQLYCFFCDAVFNNSKELSNHLYNEHDFEFEKIKGKNKISTRRDWS